MSSDCKHLQRGLLMFSVIKWTYEGSFAVVPTSWIARINETDGAFYPPNRVRERIRRAEPVGANWLHYAAKVYLGKIETFPEAEQTAKNYVDASDSEMETRKNEEMRKENLENTIGIFDISTENMKSFDTSQLNMSSNILGPLELTDLQVPASNQISSTKRSHETAFGMQSSQNGANGSFTELLATTPCKSQKPPHFDTGASTSQAPEATVSVADRSTEKNIHKSRPRPPPKKANEVSLPMIHAAIIKQTRELASVKNILMGLVAKQGLEDNDDVTDIPYHLMDINSLLEFDMKLKDDNYKRKVHNFMIPYLGDNYKRGIKAILSTIGTIELWGLYSLRGQRQKKAFQDLNLYSVLKKVCVKCKGLSYEAIDDAIGDALRRRIFQKGEKQERRNSSGEEEI